MMLKHFLEQFGSLNHILIGTQEYAVDLNTRIKEVTWASTPGTAQLQHWCRYGTVLFKIVFDTVPEFAAYLVHDDDAGNEWDNGRVGHVRRYGNDYRYHESHGPRPFAILRVVMAELEKTKRHPSVGDYPNLPSG